MKMSTHEENALDAFLFSAEPKLADLKCFRGDRPNVTEEEIRGQIHSAFMQKKMGHADVSTKAPMLNVATVDVAKFVGSL